MRLEEIAELVGSQAALARIVKVSPPTVTGWIAGSKPYPSTIKKIANRTGISERWIATGEGDKFEGGSGGPRALLRKAVQTKHLTVPKLAKRIGYDPGVIEAVVYGTARASEKMIEALVTVLPELSKEELMAGSDSPLMVREDGMEATFGAKPPFQLPPGMKGRYVPLLSMAQAGAWDAGHSDEGYAHGGIFALNVDDRRAFAIKVSGSSMEPEIGEGDYVICSPDTPIRNGQIAVVRTRSDQAFIKYWRPNGNMVSLESANPAYPPMPFPMAEIAGAWPVVQRISAPLIQKG